MIFCSIPPRFSIINCDNCTVCHPYLFDYQFNLIGKQNSVKDGVVFVAASIQLFIDCIFTIARKSTKDKKRSVKTDAPFSVVTKSRISYLALPKIVMGVPCEV